LDFENSLKKSHVIYLLREYLPVTKLNELDGTEDLSEMFVDLDDEHENDDETDDNESEVESHNELAYL
jgi:hypothetical protein